MSAQGSKQTGQDRLLCAFASNSIDPAAHPPSSIQLKIPVDVRPSIKTHPVFSEIQPPEAGGDALPGELVFDLLTCRCSDASATSLEVRPFFTHRY